MPGARALLTGTWRHPRLRLTLPWSDSGTVQAVRALPGRWWDKSQQCWWVDGVGADPERWLARHRIRLERDQGSEAAGFDLDELVEPLAHLTADGRTVYVRPRLGGFDAAAALLPGATWDKERRLLVTDVDALREADGSTLAGRIIMPATVRAAVEGVRRQRRRRPDWLTALMGCDGKDEAALAPLLEQVGDVPDAFALDLYPYQRAGALALAAGISYVADEPGAGKTRQVLAAAAVAGARRLVLVVPAVALTVWEREAAATRVWEHVVTVRGGRREPALPEAGVVVVSMDLLARREGLADRIATWRPDAMAVDEAHLLSSWSSQRSRAVRMLSKAVDGPRWAASGTPMTSGPAQLASQLAYTGDLEAVFGGYAAFMRRYCWRTPYGAWVERRTRRAELARLLATQVWVRRTKDDVLVDENGASLLPPLHVSADLVEVPLKDYRAAHREVTRTIDAYLDEVGVLDAAGVQEYVSSALPLVTMLRTAAGLAKVEVAAEQVAAHIGQHPKDGTWPRPLIVWVHHKAVAAALTERISALTGDWRSWSGATPKAERDAITDDLQAGKVGVLIASVMAANTSVTLTACSDMLFVEQEWTPGVMTQALARSWRIGQKRAVAARVLVAAGTLDEHIQARLAAKEDTLGALAPVSTDDRVGLMEGGVSARDLLTTMVTERNARRRQ